MNRYAVFLSGVAFAALTALPAGAQTIGQTPEERLAAAKTEGSVIIYTSQSTEPMEGLVKRFEAAVPGIDMQFIRSSTMIARVLAERQANRPGADVFLSWWDTALQLPALGYSATYTPTDISSFPPDAMDPNGKWMKVAGYVNVIGYNTNNISEADKPKGYLDLLDPKHKGKIGIGDPRPGGGNYFYYYTMWKTHGPSYFDDLAKNEPSIQPSDATVAAVGAGQFDLGVSGEAGWKLAQQSGAPVSYVYPEEGVNINYWYETILDNAPHPNAARVFVDWLVSPDGQDAIARVPRGIAALRPGTAPPEGMSSLTDMKVAPIDLKEFMSNETLQTVKETAAKALGLKMGE
jgi:iron(III) transport system substrate-binding protein